MRILLNKELKLAASPLSWWFVAFAGMTMIPGYPILVGAFFVCLGLFYSFQCVRETEDILYSVLLPVRKRDVVTGKYAFCCLVQMVAFAAMALLTALRMTALRDAAVYVNNVMMAANPLFLAFVLLIFTAFNTIFLGGFFRTAYRIGRPFVTFAIVALLLIPVGETLHHVPGLTLLNDAAGSRLWIQFAALAAAAAAYALGTLASLRRSQAEFEALDF